MSQRYLAPTNLFYRQNDPWPPEFPQPNTGDVYFNTVSETIRVFYGGAWHDASAGGGGGGGEGLYVLKTGDDMTGDLTLPGDPSQTNHASTKGYVDGKILNTMTGTMSTSKAPTQNAVDANFVRKSMLTVSDVGPTPGDEMGLGHVWIEY